MIVPRLVLGTARIAGGASHAEGVSMLKSAFDSGICSVDTAPSYGLGTAEDVVGAAVRGFPGVAVATKLGSHRPALPWLRTFARRIKRLVTKNGHPTGAIAAAGLPSPSGNDFSAAFMAQSLEISREKLSRIDLLLLHDIAFDEIGAAVLDDLVRLAGPAQPGYAVQTRWNTLFDQMFSPQFAAQCAPDPDWLLGRGETPPQRPLRLHSLAKTGLALAMENPTFSSNLDRAAAIIPADPVTARIAAIYALAAERIPAAQLLFTSSIPARLNSLTMALKAVDDGHTASEIAHCFVRQAG